MNEMKKLSSLLLSLGIFFSFPAWSSISIEPLLNQVVLRLNTEQWVTTKTALVSVAINAAVNDQGIEKIQNDVMKKMAQFSSADWHVVSFDRQQDKSGLESIQIVVQGRLAQVDLSALRSKAKSMSQPGETYTIKDIQFIPSEEEIRAANLQLRNIIYQQAKSEIDTLNKIYPGQKYYLHRIDFLNNLQPIPQERNMMMTAMTSNMPSTPFSVGNKEILQATVVIASMPEQVAQKILSFAP